MSDFWVAILVVAIILFLVLTIGRRKSDPPPVEAPLPPLDFSAVRKPLERPAHDAFYIDGPGDCDFEIVGEASYQAALNELFGPKSEHGVEVETSAFLIEEDNNPHDPNAVRVEIDGRRVGYLPRREAGTYRRHMASLGASGRPVAVDAIVVGGWLRAQDEGHYGVKLDMAFPPRVRRG